MELVVRQNNHRHRRVPEILREIENKPVMVDENGVQWLIKELSRNSPFKLIKPQIQELQRRKFQNHRRKLPSETIITEIQLKKQLQMLELVRNSPTKPIRVNMEQCKIHKKAKLLRKVPSNVTMVEINASYCTDLVVVGCGSTEDTSVVADIRSNPIRSKIRRVRENSLLPSL